MDVTSGGGRTFVLWRDTEIVVGRAVGTWEVVYKGQIPKRGSGAEGYKPYQKEFLPITKQHLGNLNNRRSSVESRYGGADDTPDTNRANSARYATARRSCAQLLADTRTIGKAPTFSGEHKDWPEWSLQFIAYMGSANPYRSKMEENQIAAEALRTLGFQEHNSQLHLP